LNLAKLKNKYFATRCSDGHVNIWSATNHPERLFSLFNIDADEKALAPLQPVVEEVVEVKVVKKVKITDPDASGYDSADLPSGDEGDNLPADDEPKKNKKVEPQAPVAPVLIGRPEPSVMDTMIELTKWKGLQLSSSTMICMSNWTEKKTIICEVELKTRKRVLKKTFSNNC
jgi:WD40 repeat protein